MHSIPDPFWQLQQSTPGFDDFVNDEVQVKNRRFKFPNDQFYFKTQEEMQQLFHDIPESIDNTNQIVDKVEVLNLKKDILLPAFPIPSAFQLHKDAHFNMVRNSVRVQIHILIIKQQ